MTIKGTITVTIIIATIVVKMIDTATKAFKPYFEINGVMEKVVRRNITGIHFD